MPSESSNLPQPEPETGDQHRGGIRPGPSSQRRIRVLILGNQAMVRAGLTRVLQEEASVQVVGESSTAEALRTVTTHRPDVIVLLSESVARAALDVLPVLSKQGAPILLLTSHTDTDADARALALGVRGVLALDQPPALLVKAIEKVHAGEMWLDRARTAGLFQSVSRLRRDPDEDKIASLSRRELEIVQLIGEGLRNHQIAQRLFISEATVRNHVTSILGKLDLADRFDVAVYAFRHGLVHYR